LPNNQFHDIFIFNEIEEETRYQVLKPGFIKYPAIFPVLRFNAHADGASMKKFPALVKKFPAAVPLNSLPRPNSLLQLSIIRILPTLF
jgi:hypothetical protein